jgi:molybdopterin converting factor small subunit
MAKLKLYGTARDLAGRDEIDVTIDAPMTVRELIDRVSAGRGIPPKAVRSVLVNGRNCIFMQGLDTPVGPDDLIEILPFISGG